MATLTGVMFLLPRLIAWPGVQTVTWALIGVSGAAAVAVGTRRNRPRRRLLWLLQSLGLLAFVTGDTLYDVLVKVFHQDNPFPSAADGVYLLGFFPLFGIGLYGLARSGAAIRDRAATLDALIMTAGLALLSWIFLIQPYVSDPSLTLQEKAISVAYPLFDVLVLAMIARLLATVRLTPAVALLGFGAGGLLVGDVLYGLSQLSVGWTTGGLLDLFWIAFYSGWGAAALHPSMVRLTDPKVVRGRELSRRRLLVLTLSTLIAPVVLLVQATRGQVRDGTVIALFSTALFLLVLARLAGVLKEHRQAVARERGLREAGAVLLTTTDAGEVFTAVRTAVARLLPPGADHALHLVTEAREAGRGIQMVYTRDLPVGDQAVLGTFEVTLRCPLVLGNRSTVETCVGELMVAADERVLMALQDAVEVLASQAALALARASLSLEINRRRSEAYFRTLVQNTADVILIVDEQLAIRYASPSAEHVFGTSTDPTGTPLLDHVDPVDQELAKRFLDAAGQRDGEGGDWRLAGGLEVEVSCRDLREDETVQGLVLTLRDVTERRRLERELTRRAFYDALTGLANRALFQEQLVIALGRTGRTGGAVGVLFVDIDDLKVVNDTLGHETGDQLLVAAARRLSTVAEPHGSVARLGGDEFAVLVEDIRSPVEVELIAEQIIDAFADPFAIGGGSTTVSAMVSVGVSATGEASGGDDLLRQADLALYLAKAEGKGRWRRYQAALHTAVRERMELRAALDQALADRVFTLHYQPIVDLPTGSTIGVEALVRWPHPTRGFIPPGQFIEVAEESGLIVPLGNWVLEQALDTVARWRAAGRAPYMSVNVSAKQFRSPGFVDKVLLELDHRDLPPDCLMLEITESLLLRDENHVLADLAALRDSGVRIAIDDFGTGYSSLSYLRQVPVDVLKIDKSFVDTVATSRQQYALVEGIVTLAHNLGLQVVVEGIEQPQERTLLRTMGCEYGQGYLFARPMSYSDATELIFAERVAA